MDRRLRNRFLPLYLAAFFQGFVFWYAIEKLFMTQTLGFTPQGIAVETICVVAATLAVGIPGGILADRWSRKGVLILGAVALLSSSLIGGLSTSQPMYAAGMILWGIYFGLYSGTYEGLVYDTLLDENGSGRHYEKFLGRILLFDSIGLVSSALFAGLIADKIGLRAPYFLSIPVTLFCIAALWVFKEPKLHKISQAVKLRGHLGEMVQGMVKNPAVLVVILPIAGSLLLARLLLEFNQLYYIALAVPVLLFGPLNASLLAGIGLSGIMAGKSKGKAAFYGILFTMILGCLLLVVKSTPAVLVVAQLMIVACALALSTILQGKLQGMLPSKIRAGAASTAQTLGQLMLIPTVYLFGFLTENFTIFHASWLAVVVAVLVAFGSLKHVDRAEVKG